MGKPKTPKPPPSEPEAILDEQPEADEGEVRRIRRQQGFQRQILTGALAPGRGNGTRLG
jgi:hypothetical protein